mgnify:CR=1 FL=1
MSDDPIADLLAGCAAADRAAFRTLYRDSSAKLMGVLLRILHERAEAEDALQEVYTRVWLRAGRYDPAKGRGMTWLIAIARNLAIDRLRARPAASSDDGLDLVQDSTPRAETRLTAKIADPVQALRHVRRAQRRCRVDRRSRVGGRHRRGRRTRPAMLVLLRS